MIIADYHTKVTGTEVSQMIYNSFETGKWYSRKFIKEEISRIFKLFGIVPKKAVTSHTILDFFHAVESKRKNIKGYQLTMRKGIQASTFFMKKFLYIPCFKKVPAPAYTESHLTFIQDYRTDANRVFPIISKNGQFSL